MFSEIMHSPYRLLIAAAILAALLCLFPARVKEETPQQVAAQQTQAPQEIRDLAAGADLSERTGSACMLHRTLYYAPCGHSVQRREELPSRLKGLTRGALEKEMESVIPGAAVTGFSADEVDIALSTNVPCPLHWVLARGEDGMLTVLQNRSGEALEAVRRTEVPFERVPQAEQEAVKEGWIFDDVQALEGYLESLSS